MVFIDQEGKTGHRWWLWVFLGQDTVVFRLDPTRSHDVPEKHFAQDACLILMVDRYSAYKAMAQVKNGNIVLAYCWSHVRRDFVEVGKGWGELKPWAIEWLRRIPLDNNASEREHRNPAVGRKNYYGSGALWSGNLAAMLFSIFATLHRWTLNPREWLTRYLQACAENGGKAPADIARFLPWNLGAKNTTAATVVPPDSS